MKEDIRNWILIILWVFIINLSYYYGYTLDHWSSMIFSGFAGACLGWFMAGYFFK